MVKIKQIFHQQVFSRAKLRLMEYKSAKYQKIEL